ncbi:Uncharacterized protein APZ42_016078 [Daphnia magna]|uniref:Uncharacterized protein n=1 Tax=Daphnia magna TaxID=35525 RepID=A0A162NKJ8_9CRUS|nr:Uncharacterized protein APZ42_016078 [Daphnia magna]
MKTLIFASENNEKHQSNELLKRWTREIIFNNRLLEFYTFSQGDVLPIESFSPENLSTP